jgi:hypothetical protein
MAIDYIWGQFVTSSIAEGAFTTMNEIESIQRDLSHRPFNPESESHQKFQTQLENKINKIKSKFLFMNF